MFKFKKFFLGLSVNLLLMFFLSAAFISEAGAVVWSFNDLKNAYAAGGTQAGEISGILNFTSDLDPVSGVGNSLSMTLVGVTGFDILDGNGYKGFNLTSSSRLLELKNLRLQNMNGAVRSNAENLIFEKVSFENNVLNIASQHGGAIYTYSTDTTFKGVSTTFRDNSAQNGLGGAIAAVGNSSLSFSAHTNFNDNTAMQAGGAIFIQTSSATFNAGVNFIDNISFNSFGGAIYTNTHALITFNSAVDFKGNKATNSGGAVYLDQSSAFFNYRTLFESNASTQASGGAMYLTNYSTVTIGGTADFTDNQAKLEGGAIYLEDFSTLVSASGSDITFTGNSSSSTFGGGAIYTNGASLDFLSGSSLKFNENKAYGRGGALTIYDSTASFGASNTEFAKNSAVNESGGAVYIRDGSTVTFSGKTVFSSNTAGTTGGAIASVISKLEFDASSQADFYENSAANSGGAVLLNNTEVLFNSKTLFEKNIAQSQDGGAIRAHTNSNITFNGNTTFNENSAATNGGALSLIQSTASFNGTSYFTGNTAVSSGGAVYMSGSILNINSAGGEFSASGNTANGSLNDIYMADNSVLNFIAGSNGISLNSGIISEAANNVINKTGNGTLFLGGNNDIKAQFNITGGSVVVRDGNFNYANNNSAININSASMIFNAGSTVLFSSNTEDSISISSGAATFNGTAVFSGNQRGIIASYSTLNFQNANMTFKDSSLFGGLSVHNSTFAVTGGKTLFENNDSVFGGAISVTGNSFFIFNTANGTEEIRFRGNSANNGAALYMYFSQAKLDGTLVFESNNAMMSGGAIYAENSSFENTGTSLFTGNSAGDGYNGGAVYAKGSSLSFGSFTNFVNNISSYNGGAVYAEQSSKVSFAGDADFAENTADLSGGALYLNASLSEFKGSNYSFTENTSGQYGGAIYVYGNSAAASFSGETVFSSNTADVNGGAVASFAGSLIFNGESKFKNNAVLTGFGGAVYVNGASADFMKTEFDGNTSNSDGGAVYGLNSSLSFDGETVFKNNKASYSGAGLFLSASTASFSTAVTFENNMSTMSGGLGAAIASVNNSLVTFANTVNVIGNSADSGAGFSMSDSKGEFSGAANFSNNTSSAGSGGAMSLENSVMKFNENVNFSSNSAVSGAGISATGSNINFDKDSDFSFNKALSGNGGAVNLSNSNITFNGGKVSNNSASLEGGAFYISASSLSITTNNRDFTATDNTADSLANDIYMESGSFLNLKASNYAINLNGGIISQNSTINKNGANTLYLGGENDIDGGSFNINEGKVVMLENASLDVEKMSIAGDGSFASNGIGSVNFDDFDFSGEWIVTVSSDSSDKIIADKITVNNAKLGIAGEKKKGTFSYTIMEYSSMTVSPLAMAFGGIQVENTLKSTLDITDTGTSLELTVTNMNFADIKGINENGKNVSVILDSVYEDYYNQQNDFWKNIITPIDNISSLSEMNKALDALSGSFIANALTVGSLNIGKPALFSRINTGTEKDIWAEITGGSFGYSEDDNVIGDFKGTNYGIMIGADLFKKENLIAGALIKYTGSSIEQNDDSGDITDIGLGGYAGLTFGAIELKGALQFGYQSYDLERKLEFAGQTAKGDFNGFGVLFDVEAGFNMSLTEKINAKPFVALGIGMNTNESYTESGSDANLDVDSGSYMRTRAEVGVEIGTQIEKLSLYGDLALGMLLAGNNGEIKAKLEGQEITTKGTEQGEIGGRIGIGGRYEITESLGIYAKAGFKLASNYNDISGNVGVGYKIGK